MNVIFSFNPKVTVSDTSVRIGQFNQLIPEQYKTDIDVAINGLNEQINKFTETTDSLPEIRSFDKCYEFGVNMAKTIVQQLKNFKILQPLTTLFTLPRNKVNEQLTDEDINEYVEDVTTDLFERFLWYQSITPTVQYLRDAQQAFQENARAGFPASQQQQLFDRLKLVKTLQQISAPTGPFLTQEQFTSYLIITPAFQPQHNRSHVFKPTNSEVVWLHAINHYIRDWQAITQFEGFDSNDVAQFFTQLRNSQLDAQKTNTTLHDAVQVRLTQEQNMRVKLADPLVQTRLRSRPQDPATIAVIVARSQAVFRAYKTGQTLNVLRANVPYDMTLTRVAMVAPDQNTMQLLEATISTVQRNLQNIQLNFSRTLQFVVQGMEQYQTSPKLLPKTFLPCQKYLNPVFFTGDQQDPQINLLYNIATLPSQSASNLLTQYGEKNDGGYTQVELSTLMTKSREGGIQHVILLDFTSAPLQGVTGLTITAEEAQQLKQQAILESELGGGRVKTARRW